ncbi:MAG: glycosyltransferase family 4 protein [Candidatus Aminicenantaceae bacterium]
MKVGVEISFAHKPGGARTVAINTIKSLSSLSKNDNFVVFLNKRYKELELENVEQKVLSSPSEKLQSLWDHVIFMHFILPFYMKKEDIEIAHYTNNFVPFFRPCKTVVTIHDMTPFVLPDDYSYLHRKWLRYFFRRATQFADVIITDSDNSRKDIINVFNISREKIHVIPFGISDEFFKMESDTLKKKISKYSVKDRFILNVGTLHPRKNIERICFAFKKLKEDKKIPHQLIIVGRRGWSYKQFFNLPKKLELTDEIKFLGNVPQEDLPVLYNLAEVFVYPSLYEGFGLPVLEAMACGVPIVTSNTSSIPEVAGDGAIKVNPYDVDEIAKAIYDLMSDKKLRHEMIGRGLERARKFSWERAARDTLAVYKDLSTL